MLAALSEWWVIATVIAATSQCLRSAVQRQMIPVMGKDGASYIRFLYAMPFAWGMLLVYVGLGGGVNLASPTSLASLAAAIPSMPPSFWGWVSFASVAQIVFTVLLLRLFVRRNFAAGTAFSKTEVLQAALFEVVLLGVVASLLVNVGIVLGVIAVVMLSYAKSAGDGDSKKASVVAGIFTATSLIGLASGTCLALAVVGFKAAAESLAAGDFMLRALTTAAIATSIQTISMGVWMAVASPAQLVASLRHWRGGWAAGFFGAVATAGWFSGFVLYAAAPVRAVGQIELLLTLLVSAAYFKERITRLELGAILLLLVSIITVLLAS